MTARRGRQRITLGLVLLGGLLLATGGVIAFSYIPFGALLLAPADTPEMRVTVRLVWWGVAAVGVSLVLWGRWAGQAERAASDLPEPPRLGPRQRPERPGSPPNPMPRRRPTTDPGPLRRLTQPVEWSAGGRGTVFTLGLSAADETLLQEVLQSGEAIEVPRPSGMYVARVISRDEQQVWGGPNVPFYVLQLCGVPKATEGRPPQAQGHS